MVETLSELLENAANVAEDNGGKLSIASVAVLIAEAYELGMDKATKLLTEDANKLPGQNILKSIVMQCLHTGSVGIIQLICHVKTSLR